MPRKPKNGRNLDTITAAQVLEEVRKLASIDPMDVYADDGTVKPLKDIPQDVRRAISGLETRELWEWEGRKRVLKGYVKSVKFSSKTTSLELLGKHLKLWIDRVELGVDDSLASLIGTAFDASDATPKRQRRN